MKKFLKWILIGIGAALVLAVAGFVLWGLTPLGPGPTARALLASEEGCAHRFNPKGWLEFAPLDSTPVVGFIFYPGGRVDYRSYAPLACRIAAEGYLVVIPRMPLSLAVLDVNAADPILAAYPGIQRWAIGGHSLGGAMAAQYAFTHPGAVEGLIFYAAYPPSSADLSASGLAVLSIYGSQDDVLDWEALQSTRPLLPADAEFLPLEGANHAGFGDYGPQPGDGPAGIPAEEQWRLVTRATASFLSALAR